jgi:hypothetical protein
VHLVIFAQYFGHMNYHFEIKRIKLRDRKKYNGNDAFLIFYRKPITSADLVMEEMIAVKEIRFYSIKYRPAKIYTIILN